MKFKQLYSTNNKYNGEQIQKRKYLYESIDMIDPDVARKFIKKMPTEIKESYEAKLLFANYDPMLKTIVNSYISSVFEPQLSVIATNHKYNEITANADGKQTEFQDFLAESLKVAEYIGCSYIGVDLPVAKPSVSRLHQLNSNPYVYHIDPETVIDWQQDDLDNFQWIKLYEVSEKPREPESQSDKQLVHTISIWKRLDNSVKLTKYKFIQPKNSSRLSKEQEVSEIIEFELPILDIPVIKIDLKENSIISTIQGLIEKYFCDQTNYKYAVNKNAFPVPYMLAGAEYQNEVISNIQSDEDRVETAMDDYAKKGFMVAGADDKFGFLQASGECFKLMQDDLKTQKDIIYHSVSLLAQSLSASTLGSARSAASKNADNKSFNQALEYLGRQAMDAAKKIFCLMQDLTNDDSEIEISGLSNYNYQDRELLIDEAIGVATLDLPSDTFKRKYAAQTAIALINNLDPLTEKEIVSEIESAEHQHEEEIV